jgi:chromosome partitioning protein
MKGIEGQTWILFQQEFLPLNLLYDYVIFDCPPGISPLTEVVIRASDLVIVPTIPDFISVFGLNAFCESIWKGPQSSLPRPKLLPHVLVTRWRKGVRQQDETVERLEAEAEADDAGIYLLNTRIQQAAALAEALARDGVPTFRQKYGQMTFVLDQLVQELKGVLHGN